LLDLWKFTGRSRPHQAAGAASLRSGVCTITEPAAVSTVDACRTTTNPPNAFVTAGPLG